MNRTIKEATVKRFHYGSHERLRGHLTDFLNAYNFARRLKTLRGLTPFETICKAWTDKPHRFRADPLHQFPGLNTQNRAGVTGVTFHDLRGTAVTRLVLAGKNMGRSLQSPGIAFVTCRIF